MEVNILNDKSMSLRQCNQRLYQIWANMKCRCNNQNHGRYEKYGGRGIIICEEWDDFENFYEWSMENGYQDDLTIERIDNDGSYESSNCKWITKEFQTKNRSICYMVAINGETKTVLEWCEIFNLNYNTFNTRHSTYGWGVVKALTTPVKLRKKPAGFNTKLNENKSAIRDRSKNKSMP